MRCTSSRTPGVFGGIDLDWEFPVSDGAPSKLPARPADRADATLLLAEFRRQLDQLDTATHRHYLLTAAMPAFSAPGYTPETSWNLGAAAALVDWFNLMTYDMTGRYSPVTGFESPLHATPSGSTPHPPAGANTVDAALALYEGAGVPAAKIVLGAPFYGHLFTHVPGHYNGLFQRFRKLGDTPSYAALAASAPSGLRHWSPYADEPWVYDHRTRTFLSYDDPQAMAAKAAYVLARHLRGAMIWEIGMDTASHSLLNALTAPLLASG